LLYEMYKMNRYPYTCVVHCTLQMKLHVVLGVHSKAVGRHRPTVPCTVLEIDFFLKPLIVHEIGVACEVCSGAASMYLKKHTQEVFYYG